MKSGDIAILNEGDWCGTRTRVTIVKIHKGGNVIVLDGEQRREVGLVNLTPLSDHACKEWVDLGGGMEQCVECERKRCYAPDPDDDRSERGGGTKGVVSRQYHCLVFLQGGRAICSCGRWQYRIATGWGELEKQIVRTAHAAHKKRLREKPQERKGTYARDKGDTVKPAND